MLVMVVVDLLGQQVPAPYLAEKIPDSDRTSGEIGDNSGKFGEELHVDGNIVVSAPDPTEDFNKIVHKMQHRVGTKSMNFVNQAEALNHIPITRKGEETDGSFRIAGLDGTQHWRCQQDTANAEIFHIQNAAQRTIGNTSSKWRPHM